MEVDLVKKGFIPLEKYWSIRLCFLDIINGTRYFIPLVENRNDVGDDLRTAIRISKEWKDNREINVGEAGFLFRLLQFASWKFKLDKSFVKERTLKQRQIYNDPEIVNWPIEKLLELDNKTTQWASAAILTGSKEDVPEKFFLNMTKEALAHYNGVKEKGGFCEIRYDRTLLLQADAFLDLLRTGVNKFNIRHVDDYCFARAFNLTNKVEGREKWPELAGHESNRLEEMEVMLKKFYNNEEINSRDHRVVQAIAMLSVSKGSAASFTHPKCVSKSWPQFWKFLDFARAIVKTKK